MRAATATISFKVGQIKLQSIEIYTPRKDAAGKLMGIKQETVLYDRRRYGQNNSATEGSDQRAATDTIARSAGLA